MKINYKSRGLGDTIDKITTVTGIKKIIADSKKEKECSPCEKRRQALNKMFPYKK